MTTQHLQGDLEKDEGRRSHAYRDSVGKWTIGIGHNLDIDGDLHPQLQHLISDGLTDPEIDKLFAHDQASAEHALDVCLPWWRKLDDVRQDVVFNMTFNMGMKTLLTFHNTLEAMRTAQWGRAAAGMRASLWARQVKGRAARLALQMETGAHQDRNPT